MQEVAISEFKAKCLALLEEVSKTKKPIRVTRFGKPIADVMPPALGPRAGCLDWLHEGFDGDCGRHYFSRRRGE